MYYYLTDLSTLNLIRAYNIYWSHVQTSTNKYKQVHVISNAIYAFFHQFSDGVRVRQLRSGGTAKVKGLNPGLVWGPIKLLWNPFSNNECETFGCSSTG